MARGVGEQGEGMDGGVDGSERERVGRWEEAIDSALEKVPVNSKSDPNE